MSTGALYRFGTSIANSTFLTTLDAGYYTNPSLLVSATAPAAPSVTASVTGNQLTLTPASGFSGAFQVNVTAADPFTSTTVSFITTSPRWTPLP